MLLISHRGNTNGPDRGNENKPSTIDQVLTNTSFMVEVDVRLINGVFYLGHDFPTHIVSLTYLMNDRIICHAKNFEAFDRLLKAGAHVFWHENDDHTLTSRGYIWTYPDKQVGSRSIIVDTSEMPTKYESVAGICSDYVLRY